LAFLREQMYNPTIRSCSLKGIGVEMIASRLLRGFEVFEGLSEEELDEIVPLCRREHAEAGKVLFEEGDPADRLFLVLYGEVALELGVELWPGAPKRKMRVETLKEGGLFGWSALIPPHRRTLAARSLCEVELLTIPGEEVRSLLEKDPKLGYKLLERISQLVASRLKETRDKLTEFRRGEQLATEFTPEEATLIQRLRYFIAFRWIASAGVIAVALFAHIILGISFPFVPVLLIALGIALYNLGFLIHARRALAHDGPSLLPRARGSIHLQSLIDLVAFTFLLRFTGGIENPFIFYYIFHIVIASVLLPYRSAYLITTAAAAMITTLASLEYFGVIPHIHLEGFLPFEFYNRGAVVLGVLFALITTLYVATYIATSIAGELRKRQREVAALKDRYMLNARELEEANRRLVELDRLRTHFLAIASHDLKAPLAAVQSYLNVILGGFVGEAKKEREMLERSRVRIDELIKLINDLLDATRIEKGQIVQELEEVNLEEVIQSALEDVRPQAEEKGLIVEAEIPEGLAPIMAAPRRLKQVLTNLLTNAVKFTSSSGKVRLKVTDCKEQIEVVVQDTGVGISKEDLPQIFEEFYRSKEAEGKGAGLGLAIARKIVEAHGGRIWAESPDPETGKGSRFTFTLPKGGG
jgi:signal transduction histidine kinase/CRP-like cAMP-binding protein